MLSKKSQYAFKALAYLVERKDRRPVLIAEIAEAKKIPLKFLESILLDLRKAHILESKRGKGGGYYLTDEGTQVTLLTVMRLVNGPIALLPCVSLNFYQACDDCSEAQCGLHDTMVAVRDATLEILGKKTIRDLVK